MKKKKFMNCLYTLSNHKALLIYPNENYIFLRHKTNEQISRPTILAKDYQNYFCSTPHDKTLYYCYQTSEHHIVVKTINQTEVLYQGDCGENATLTHLQLLSFQNQLILFYGKEMTTTVSHQPTEASSIFQLNCLFPLKKDITITKISSKPQPTDVRILPMPNHILLHLNNGQQQTTYLMNHNYEFSELVSLKTYQTKLQYELTSQQQEWNQKLQEYQHTIAQKESVINQQLQMIESAKVQYEELMHVAEQYRKEALKWRGKFV